VYIGQGRPDFNGTAIPQEPLHFRAGMGNIKLVCRVAKPVDKGYAAQRRGIAVVAGLAHSRFKMTQMQRRPSAAR
jgi:hypothetical protein